jgi:predicted dehydrogenase
MDPLRMGLVGAGKHGSRYAHHIVADLSREIRLVALWRRDREAGEAAARQYGCRYEPDVARLLAASDIDAVAIVVPPTLHAELCVAAARAGKAILLEKPAAVSRADADRIQAALARTPVHLMVAHTLRFNTVVRTLRERLADVGPLRTVFLSQRFERSPLEWLDQRSISGGGIIIHTGVHSFDLLRFLTGAEPESVWSRAWRTYTSETEDNFAAHIGLAGGIHAVVMGSRATDSRSGLIEITGADGQLVADHVHHQAYFLHGATRTAIDLPPAVPTVREVLRSFAKAIRLETAPAVGWEEGRAAVAVAEACYRSVECGQTVRVAP